MNEVDRRPDAEADYETHLERSQRVWDRWSDWYSMSEEDFAPHRERLIEALELERGEQVLDVGCGPGVNLEVLRSAVGAEGEIVAVDYSPAMVEQARDRVDEHGWANVSVVRADATTADLGSDYDAAVATLALSVMPDVERAVANIQASLAPDGRLGVLDIHPFTSGFRQVLNPAIRGFLRWYANWNGDVDVRTAVDSRFAEVTDLETHMYGMVSMFVARWQSSQ